MYVYSSWWSWWCCGVKNAFELTVSEPHTSSSEAKTPYTDATNANSTMGNAGDAVLISLMNLPKKWLSSLDGGKLNSNTSSVSKMQYNKLAKTEIYPITNAPVFKSEQPKNVLMRAIFKLFYVLFVIFLKQIFFFKHTRDGVLIIICY